MLDTIKALCALPGVSGSEDAVRTYIKNRIAPHVAELRTDPMGNLIAYKKGRKTPSKKVLLCAHMDEVGIIITGMTDDGFLKFDSVGGIDRRVLIGKKVYVGDSGVFGIIGNKAYHLVDREDRDRIPSLDAMYIDIGAKTKDEAKKLVTLGDVGTFDPGISEFGNGYIKAKALDDRVGCAVLIRLIESALPVDCWFAFTVQEEVGTRGAYAASFSVEPDIACIVEGTTAADLPSVSSSKRVCALNKGAVVPFMDNGTIYNKELYGMLTRLADDNGIPWQTKTTIAGGTDAAAVQRSRGGVMTAGIAVPLRSLHSPASVGCVVDFEAVYRLTELLLEELGRRY
jgi:endoglucanase